MKASAWEFRHRSLLIGAIFFVAFFLSGLDPVPAAAWVARQLAGTPAPVWTVRAVYGAAALVLVAAAAVRTWGTAYLGSSVVYDSRVRVEGLVAGGPYRHVRNPLYIGTILVGVGLGALASPAGWAVLVGGLTLLVLRLIGREEDRMARERGDAFRVYRESVPRLLPALRPRVPRSDARPDWRDGWIAEAPMWLFAAGAAAMAVTLSPPVTWAFVGAGVALMVVLGLRSRAGSGGESES